MIFAFYRSEIIAPVEGAQVDFVGGLGRPQTQRVGGLRVVAGDDGVVGHGLNFMRAHPLAPAIFFQHLATELHPVHHLGPGKFPGVALGQPIVGHFHLATVHNGLAEHAVVIPYAVAITGDIEGGHRIQKAGR